MSKQLCFNEKNQHIGKLERLVTVPCGWSGEADLVVNWCPACGAVVVDEEVDGRCMGYFVKMKFPEITRKALKK